MNQTQGFSRSRPPRLPIQFGGGAMWAGLLAPVVLLAILFLPVWIWFFWRIEPQSGKIAVLIRKTGKDLPSGQILALEPSQKGIQLDVLPEGRYFKNPYTWDWQIKDITDIPSGQLGVMIRMHGTDLPAGEIIAPDGCKGILKEVLRPGKYRLNPFAVSVELHPAISIRPGSVGVVTRLTGADVLTTDLPADQRNAFLVSDDLKGVQNEVLDPGTYYLHPYMFSVVEVTLQSQRFELSGEDAITFLTSDGFTINVEGTIEYALIRDKAALLTHQVGDMQDILKKVILPRTRGFSRIEGSKHPAKNFITGDTRQQFQNNLQEHLQKICLLWGIDVRSVLIRNIAPPDEIASIIRDREVAVQTAKKFEQQSEQARSQAELTRQEMLAQQNKAKVESDTVKIRAVIRAQQEQSVLLTAANRELEVARIENDAAKAQAEAVMLKANAEKEVIKLRNEAEASVFASQVKAYGSGMMFARHAFYERVGPQIQTILSGDGEDSLGGLFLPYVPQRKEVTK